MARKKRTCSSRQKNRTLASKLARTRLGRAAMRLRQKFWGVKTPPEILKLSLPGKSKVPLVFTGLGRSPAVTIANGPKGKATRIVRIRHSGRILAADPKGRRLFILRRRAARTKMRGRNRLKFLGWAAVTEYVPPRKIEKAGSFKKNKWWIHKHDDDGGQWPRIYSDSAGNIIYGPGTYRVGEWIER